MKPPVTIAEACEKYIQAIIAAKRRSTNPDGFWKDKRADKAYRHLYETIEANVPADLKWSYTIWELAGSTAEQVLEGRFVETTDGPRFCRQVTAYLEALTGFDWVACLPLENAFCGFPAYTDFGGFCLVNPVRPNEARDLDALLARFRGILTEKLGIEFIEPTGPNNESYLRLGDHYFNNKSDGYIPGRPQMVIRAGRGDEFINKQLLPGLARQQFSLLSLCQIAYGLKPELKVLFGEAGAGCLPTGERMQSGFIRIPDVAVAIVAKTGDAAIWATRLEYFETEGAQRYEPDKFIAIWNETARPVLHLEGAMVGPVGDAVRNAIRLVAKCRHRMMGDLTLNSVIATETILNPFRKKGTSEGFAVFAATLTGETTESRLATYEIARSLYKLRNTAVHSSEHHDDKKKSDSGKQAFGLFRACLKGILQWVKETAEQGKKCDEKEFRKFYLRTVLGGCLPA
jgi:hypothetical protein